MHLLVAIATRVVQDCQSLYNLRISQLLATYVVRTVAFSDPIRFDLAQQLSPADILDLTKVHFIVNYILIRNSMIVRRRIYISSYLLNV